MKPLLEVGTWHLIGTYSLFLIPLGVMLWLKLPLLGRMTIAAVRMTVQLLFVGFYLEVIFGLNNPWLNLGWLLVMISVADVSIIRSAGLHLRYFMGPLFVGLVLGTGIPLLVFLHLVLQQQNLFEAQYAIPIGGMIMGNCLRANIVGLREFYNSVRNDQKVYLQCLAQGATRTEALLPYLRNACSAALSPTIASMSTIGLVSLPGMMTGVIMGGNDPSAAIKYQIAIMIAIFVGTTITVFTALNITIPGCFDGYGLLKEKIFKTSQ